MRNNLNGATPVHSISFSQVLPWRCITLSFFRMCSEQMDFRVVRKQCCAGTNRTTAVLTGLHGGFLYTDASRRFQLTPISPKIIFYTMWPMQTDLGNLELVSCCRPHFAGESKLISKNTHRLRRVQLFVTLWAAAHQAPLSTRFSRQEYWSGFPFLTPGNLLDPRISPMSPALAGGFFYSWITWEAPSSNTLAL